MDISEHEVYYLSLKLRGFYTYSTNNILFSSAVESHLKNQLHPRMNSFQI